MGKDDGLGTRAKVRIEWPEEVADKPPGNVERAARLCYLEYGRRTGDDLRYLAVHDERKDVRWEIESNAAIISSAIEAAVAADRKRTPFAVTAAELDELFRCAGIMRELGNGKTSSHASANTALSATAEHAAKVQGVVDRIRARAR